MTDPHRDQPVLSAGAALGAAKTAMVMLHGRGANAADILGLSSVIKRPDMAFLAPEAAGHAWYPRPFLAPVAANEPHLTSALARVGSLIEEAVKAGIPVERVVLLGFSQGACLSLEYAARHPRRYGGVVALSGGLIGERVSADAYAGSLDGTPVFVGCSDVDAFIPLPRVQESAAIMRGLGAAVTERIYAGAGHTVVPDEIGHIQAIVDAL